MGRLFLGFGFLGRGLLFLGGFLLLWDFFDTAFEDASAEGA